MFKLNLKIAWRSLLKYKNYTLINIIGLSLGLAGFIFVMLFINHEKSYDTWDAKLSNIYQVQEYSDYFPVETDFRWKDNVDRRLTALFRQLPEVDAMTMIEKETERGITTADKRLFLQTGLRRTDSLFFKVMPYQFKYGSADAAFQKPYSIVLKAAVAEKYFGSVNPVGQVLVIAERGKGSEKSYTITGVVEEPATPSILNFEAVYADNGADFRFGGRFDPAQSTELYVRTNKLTNIDAFNSKIQNSLPAA